MRQKKITVNKDILLVLVLLLIALTFWGVRNFMNRKPQNSGPFVEVICGGEVVDKVYLDEDRVFTVPEVPQVEFEIKDHQIAFSHSNCPDQVCVYTGFLGEDGQFAACLPNDIMLWVTKEES